MDTDVDTSTNSLVVIVNSLNNMKTIWIAIFTKMNYIKIIYLFDDIHKYSQYVCNRGSPNNEHNLPLRVHSIMSSNYRRIQTEIVFSKKNNKQCRPI